MKPFGVFAKNNASLGSKKGGTMTLPQKRLA